ncbi:MAG TPA: MFS transporter [Sumerlaeia bacterium]|nr:MFS transporter [Sumerlaeia bacterium]
MTGSVPKPFNPSTLRETPSLRRAYVYAAVATAFSLLGDVFMYTLLPVQFADLGLGKKQVGVLLSMNRFVRLATNRLAGGVCDRAGVSRPFILATALGACVCASYGLVRGFVLLLIGRCVWGLCWSFIRLGYLQTTVRHAAEKNLGAAMGVTSGLSRLGALAGAALGGVLSDAIGFRRTAFVLAGLSALAVIPASLSQRYRPDRGRGGKRSDGFSGTEAPRGDSGGESPGAATNPHAETRPAPRGPLSLLGANFAVGLVGGGIILSTLGRLLQERFAGQIDVFGRALPVATATGFVLAMRWAVDIVFAPLMGGAADRWGRRRTICLSFAAGGTALLLVPGMQGFAPLVAAVLFLFFCGATAGIALSAEASVAVPPAGRNRYLSWFVTASDLGAACGPLLAWTAIDGVATRFVVIRPVALESVYVAGSVVYFGALALTLVGAQRRRRQRNP